MKEPEETKPSVVSWEGSSFRIPPRSTAAMISILSLSLSVLDTLISPACYCRRGRGLKELVNWLRILLLLLFQLANLLLLVASVVENATLIRIYVWYTIAFVIAGAVVALMDYMYRTDERWALFAMLVEMAFLFVTFRCIPLVESYQKSLEGLVSSPDPAPASASASASAPAASKPANPAIKAENIKSK